MIANKALYSIPDHLMFDCVCHRPGTIQAGVQPKDGGEYRMFHGTNPEVAALIEQGGFLASTQGLLGPGVYVSRDVRKCRKYGRTILEVMVRVGKVCRADKHPELIPRGYGTEAPWHDVGGFDSAWVPPDCPASVFAGAHYDLGIVEEDCVWDPMRVTVLGRAEDDGDAATAIVVWCFEENSMRHAWQVSEHSATMGECWMPFSQLKSNFIESHYRIWRQGHGQESVPVVCGESRKLFFNQAMPRYEVFFDQMVEMNLQTRVKRKLKRNHSLKGAASLLEARARAYLARDLLIKTINASRLLQKRIRGHGDRHWYRLIKLLHYYFAFWFNLPQICLSIIHYP